MAATIPHHEHDRTLACQPADAHQETVQMIEGLRLPLIALVSAGIGAGAIIAYRATVPAPGVLACRANASNLARLELLFGSGSKNGREVSEGEWQSFLDAEITPRFPDGLTVLTGYGQWRNPSDAITKEQSRMLIILYQPAADSDARIEAIRTAYKTRFGQESVMRVDGASCVSF
jgi:hypothetical protein